VVDVPIDFYLGVLDSSLLTVADLLRGDSELANLVFLIDVVVSFLAIGLLRLSQGGLSSLIDSLFIGESPTLYLGKIVDYA
jgi:hypothetical protein